MILKVVLEKIKVVKKIYKKMLLGVQKVSTNLKANSTIKKSKNMREFLIQQL